MELSQPIITTESHAGGLYIHIPFCKQKCDYCNFYSTPSSKSRKELISAIAKELILQKSFLETTIFQTLYFGGGTPSILTFEELMFIMDTVFQHYNFSSNAEITIEANPDDLNNAKIRELKNSPVNRLSIGIQSFSEKDLKYLNRIHSARQSEFSIKASQDAGFENISIDLIYGIPTLSEEQWNQNMLHAVSFMVPHISAYSLTVEPHTTLEVLINKGKKQNTDESSQAKHFEMAMDTLEREGYIHYEISNFCKEGFYSKHNSNYWKGVPYLGIGPSAHSFNGDSRQWNTKNIQQYISSVEKKIVPCEKENLDTSTQYNEYVLTHLRTKWGCEETYIKLNFGDDFLKHFIKSASKYISSEIIEEKNKIYTLTHKGKLLADAVTADLFF